MMTETKEQTAGNAGTVRTPSEEEKLKQLKRIGDNLIAAERKRESGKVQVQDGASEVTITLKVGSRVEAREGDGDYHKGTIVSLGPVGPFVRKDTTGTVFGATWDGVTLYAENFIQVPGDAEPSEPDAASD